MMARAVEDLAVADTSPIHLDIRNAFCTARTKIWMNFIVNDLGASAVRQAQQHHLYSCTLSQHLYYCTTGVLAS